MSELEKAIRDLSQPSLSDQERFKSTFRRYRQRIGIDTQAEEFLAQIERQYPDWFLETTNKIRLLER